MKLQPGILGALLLLPTTIWAEAYEAQTDQWQLCPEINTSQTKYRPPEPFAEDQKQEARISAKQVENVTGDLTVFSGDVLIERDMFRMTADQADFNRPNQTLDVLGNIHIDVENMAIDAKQGWFDLNNNKGELSDSQYYLPNAHFRGATPTLSLIGDKETLLIDSSFSSCPEDNESWKLNMALLKLDHENAVGTAKHAVLEFQGIPIFYSPYISFPLGDERRSGFLMPSFGTSDSRGFEFATPWYWNIAPNQDAIITPHYMRKRGLLLNTNYRYLTQSSNGELDVEYINNDDETDEERYLLKYSNHSNISHNTTFDLLINDASDDDYLDDMSNNISIANSTHLERTATLKHRIGDWSATVLAQTYETIDDSIAIGNRPYRRLPQLTLSGSENILDSDAVFSFTSEWVEFEHDSSSKATGQRLDAYPRLSWPLQGNAWFITPSLGLRHTQYDVIDASNNEIDIDDRNLTISSLDAGLFFERDLSDGNYLQTLEPRLFYLNIPYEDQSNIPLFDTGALDFSFAQLFREERFSGVDRVGDTNQLTFGLTSRLLEKQSGEEFMSLSIGQIYYNEDRRVNLDNSVSTENQSDIVAELSGRVQHWAARASVLWNTDTDEADKRSIQLNYKQPDNRLFNIAYRFRRDAADATNNLEQTDVSFSWPINRLYSMVGRWNYSITEKRDIETLFGIEYQSCCWAMRLVTQRYLTDDLLEPYDSSVMFQLVLKGLGSVHGKKTTDTLKHAILGYQSDY